MVIDQQLVYPNEVFKKTTGIGLTSQKNRDQLVKLLQAKGLRCPKLINAFRITPRHLFVEKGLEAMSYNNNPLPIGFNQTISQPQIVMHMTQEICTHLNQQNLCKNAKILEIGTGCGYQTALLSLLFNHIYTVEVIAELQAKAKKLLKALKLENISYSLGDGHWGWPNYHNTETKFDAIIVTAAHKNVPKSLTAQLKNNAIMIIPTYNDKNRNSQVLLKIVKSGGKVKVQELMPVKFVPLVESKQQNTI